MKQCDSLQKSRDLRDFYETFLVSRRLETTVPTHETSRDQAPSCLETSRAQAYCKGAGLRLKGGSNYVQGTTTSGNSPKVQECNTRNIHTMAREGGNRTIGTLTWLATHCNDWGPGRRKVVYTCCAPKHLGSATAALH